MKPVFHAQRPTLRLVAVALLFSACLLLTSCSGPTNTSEVSGTVTYKGTPLTGGTITFRSSDMKRAEEGGTFGQAEIQPDGSYVIHSLTPGPKVVTIEVDTTTGRIPPGATMPPGFGKTAPTVTIPAKFADPKKNGLTYDMKPGKQTKDWPLD